MGWFLLAVLVLWFLFFPHFPPVVTLTHASGSDTTFVCGLPMHTTRRLP